MSIFARSLFLAGMVASSSLWAIPILLRPLPTANLNDAAGANRSNQAFAEMDADRFSGDNFILSPGSWTINSITTWSVGSILGEAIGNEFSSISLFGRTYGGTMQTIATGAPGTTFDSTNPDLVLNSNPFITSRQVQYSNGSDYEAGGYPYPIWEHTFSNLNWNVTGGDVIEFAVWGQGINQDSDTLYGYWFNHMSNAALNGAPFLQFSNSYLVFDFGGMSNPAFARNPLTVGLWDKGADMNIVINASPNNVPEPGTIGLMTAGLGLLVLATRRRRTA